MNFENVSFTFMRHSISLVCSMFCFLVGRVHVSAFEASDSVVFLNADVEAYPPKITLNWHSTAVNPVGYTISRKLRDEGEWLSSITLFGMATSWSDENIVLGTAYEYKVEGVFEGGQHAFGYLLSGVEVGAVENRGGIILLVEDAHASVLSSELKRLQEDLIGDGWFVIRHDVSGTSSVSEIKKLIHAEYIRDSANLKAVFLFGRIPVPYSGKFPPDGHSPSHAGAWPADVFYGDMEGDWTDSKVNETRGIDPRNHNIPGDGKFDNLFIPGTVALQVGRVDFANMSSLGESEAGLLKHYLDKNHVWRHKESAPLEEAFVIDGFESSKEAFSGSGWRNFGSLLGLSRITAGNLSSGASEVGSEECLFGFISGLGTWSTLPGITLEDWNGGRFQAVFTLLFGSYFGDWDSENNLLRGVLTSPKGGLAACFAGRPQLFLHHMGLGESIGASIITSQNNVGVYMPMGFGANGTHIALLGDPTLRMRVVAPPKYLSARMGKKENILLTWTASEDDVVGYHIYRSESPRGPFVRRNDRLVTATSFEDEGSYSQWYQVRAVTLLTGNSGSYYDLSQAVCAPVLKAKKEVQKDTKTVLFRTSEDVNGVVSRVRSR